MHDPNRLLTTSEAAGYLAVSYATMQIWAKKGKINVVYLGKRRPRFMLADLDEIILAHRVHRWVWDVDSKELPLPVVQRLLQLKRDTAVSSLLSQGKLADYSEQSVRRYIRFQLLDEVKVTLRKEYRKRLSDQRSIMGNQKVTIRLLRRKLEEQLCNTCRRNKLATRPPHPSKWTGTDERN